jgi:hypothetical protein
MNATLAKYVYVALIFSTFGPSNRTSDSMQGSGQLLNEQYTTSLRACIAWQTAASHAVPAMSCFTLPVNID